MYKKKKPVTYYYRDIIDINLRKKITVKVYWESSCKKPRRKLQKSVTFSFYLGYLSRVPKKSLMLAFRRIYKLCIKNIEFIYMYKKENLFLFSNFYETVIFR